MTRPPFDAVAARAWLSFAKLFLICCLLTALAALLAHHAEAWLDYQSSVRAMERDAKEASK